LLSPARDPARLRIIPSSPMTAAIRIDQVKKRFGALQALDGVSLDIAAGEFFGLLGPKPRSSRSLPGLPAPTTAVSASLGMMW
jgi:ABC-2 type transport system ATP-binding protein